MTLKDATSITYQEAEALEEEVLRRWLRWALRGDPAEARILRESSSTKEEILRALVWMGAVG